MGSLALDQAKLDGQRAIVRNEAKVLAKLTEVDPYLTHYAPLLDVLLPIPFPDN